MKKLLIPIFLSFFTTLFLIFHLITDSVVFSLVPFLALIVYILVEKEEINLLYVLSYLISFNVVFKFDSSSISLFSFLELLTIIVFSIKRKTIYRSVVVPIVVLVCFIMIVDVIHYQFTINEYIRQAVNLLLLYFLLLYSKNFERVRNLLLFFVIGVIVTSFIGLFAKNIPYFYSYIRHVGLNPQVTNRFSGMNGDPNYYSIDIILAISGLMYLYAKRRIKWFFWIAYPTLSYFGIMTISKSFILMWALSALTFFVILMQNKRYINLFVYSLLLVVAGVVLFSGSFADFNTLLSRFLNNNDTIAGLTSGRTSIWSSYLEAIFTDYHFLIGYGVSAPDVNGLDPHNSFIELVYYFGFLGTALYAYCYVLVLSNYKVFSYKGRKLSDYFGFVILIFMYFFLQMVHFNEISFHLGVAYLILQINRQDCFAKNVNLKECYVTKN